MNHKMSFLEKAVPFLEDIYSTDEKRQWCQYYSVYSSNEKDIWNLRSQLQEFIKEAYEYGFVPPDYAKTYEKIQFENVYGEKIDRFKLAMLSDEQIVAIIAKQFRNDHFCEGILINKYIADGLTLYYMKELFYRLNTKEKSMEIT